MVIFFLVSNPLNRLFPNLDMLKPVVPVVLSLSVWLNELICVFFSSFLRFIKHQTDQSLSQHRNWSILNMVCPDLVNNGLVFWKGMILTGAVRRMIYKWNGQLSSKMHKKWQGILK